VTTLNVLTASTTEPRQIALKITLILNLLLNINTNVNGIQYEQIFLFLFFVKWPDDGRHVRN
jgi:hypothetical protein